MAKFKIPIIKVGTPVIIHWFDAHQDPSEMGEAKEILHGDCECLDIGWWCGTKGRFITIGVEKYLGAYAGQFRHANRIPKVNVIHIQVLNEPTYNLGSDRPTPDNTRASDGDRGGASKRGRARDVSNDSDAVPATPEASTNS